MRHRRRGRQLGRTSPHRKAMLRNMASSLFLTERSELANEIHGNTPRVRRRIVTTIQKAKEVRSIVEKCITLARKVQPCYDEAAALIPDALREDADKQSSAYKDWRSSDQWQEWAAARAPIVNAQRKALQMLGSREAVDILFNDIAPALLEEAPERVSGFTRILKIAKPRLGDNGTQAILEIVGESNNRDTSGSDAPQAPVLEDDTEDTVADDDIADVEVEAEAADDADEQASSEEAEEASEEEADQDEVDEATEEAEEAPAEETAADEAEADTEEESEEDA